MAQAVREREQELVTQMSHQTAAAKRRAEEEAENGYVEMMASERQAVMTANSQFVDVNAASAAFAAARIAGERVATASAVQERQELQEQLQTAGLEAANAQIATATIVNIEKSSSHMRTPEHLFS
eukprot:6463459-Pyramimonas_sp.AAC.1